MDVGTVIPSLLIRAGGGSVALGLLTTIMLGGSSLVQLVFAGWLSPRPYKKRYLLLGIHLRVLALLAMAGLLAISPRLPGHAVVPLIFVLISLFSFSGSFAAVSYVDILGKAVDPGRRKHFFSLKQVVNSVGLLASAVLVRWLLRRHVYPWNYALLFLIAGLLLWLATAGFWALRESEPSAGRRLTLPLLLRSIPGEIRRNPNLGRYLLAANTVGLGVSLLPFTILYAKVRFGLGGDLVGNMLLLRTVGMLAAGLLLFRLARRFLYRDLLRLCAGLGAVIPPLCLLLGNHRGLYELLFVVVGLFAAGYKTAMSGILLEISSTENRAFYAGLAGAGNILTTIFPLLAGWLLATLGYRAVFLGVAGVVLAGGILTRRLYCGAVAPSPAAVPRTPDPAGGETT